MRILIVEDEQGIFNFLKQGLEEETYVVAIAEDGNKKINFNWDMEAAAEVPHYYSNPILDKVISNAIKYSKDNGSISIRISQNNSHLLYTITDYGIGIKKQQKLSVQP